MGNSVEQVQVKSKHEISSSHILYAITIEWSDPLYGDSESTKVLSDEISGCLICN